jgi:pimeloyl-ACP methyl ester carboxylesterase
VQGVGWYPEEKRWSIQFGPHVPWEKAVSAGPSIVHATQFFEFLKGLADMSVVGDKVHAFLFTRKEGCFLGRFASSAFNRDVNRAVYGGLEQFDLSPEIRKFRFPVLIVTGRYDMNVAPLVAYRIHQAVPNSKFVVFEHSGHLPFYEEPEAFANVVETFLAGN